MATATKSFEEQLQSINDGIAKWGQTDDALRAQEAKPFRNRTLKMEIGALLRGQIRRELALHTSLEVKEIKGFLESVFILTARNERELAQMYRVQAWLRRIAEDD